MAGDGRGGHSACREPPADLGAWPTRAETAPRALPEAPHSVGRTLAGGFRSRRCPAESARTAPTPNRPASHGRRGTRQEDPATLPCEPAAPQPASAGQTTQQLGLSPSFRRGSDTAAEPPGVGCPLQGLPGQAGVEPHPGHLLSSQGRGDPRGRAAEPTGGLCKGAGTHPLSSLKAGLEVPAAQLRSRPRLPPPAGSQAGEGAAAPAPGQRESRPAASSQASQAQGSGSPPPRARPLPRPSPSSAGLSVRGPALRP